MTIVNIRVKKDRFITESEWSPADIVAAVKRGIRFQHPGLSFTESHKHQVVEKVVGNTVYLRVKR